MSGMAMMTAGLPLVCRQALTAPALRNPPPHVLTLFGVVTVGLQMNPNAGGMPDVSLFIWCSRTHKAVAVVAVVQILVTGHQVAHERFSPSSSPATSGNASVTKPALTSSCCASRRVAQGCGQPQLRHGTRSGNISGA